MNDTVSQIQSIQSEILAFLDQITAMGKEQFLAIKSNQTHKIADLLERKKQYMATIEKLKDDLKEKLIALKKNTTVDTQSKRMCTTMFDTIQKKIQNIIRHEHRDLHTVLEQQASIEKTLKGVPAGKRVLHTYQNTQGSSNSEKQWEG